MDFLSLRRKPLRLRRRYGGIDFYEYKRNKKIRKIRKFFRKIAEKAKKNHRENML